MSGIRNRSIGRSKFAFLAWVAACLLATCIVCAGCSGPQGSADDAASGVAPSVESDGAPVLQDDFYRAVNYETLQSWEIPASEGSISTMGNVSKDVSSRMEGIVADAVDIGTASEGDARTVGALYASGMDMQSRNEGGNGSYLGAYLDEIDSASTVHELMSVVVRFSRETGGCSLVTPSVDYAPDDTSRAALSFYSPDVWPSKEVLLSEDEGNKELARAAKDLVVRLWEIQGASAESAQEIVDGVWDMRLAIAAAGLDAEQVYDASLTTNPYTLEEFSDLLRNTVSADDLAEIYGFDANAVVYVCDVGAYEALASYLDDANLDLLKHYVRSVVYTDYARYVDEESLDAYQDYEVVQNGTSEKQELSRIVMDDVQQSAMFECGRLFCDAYLTEETKSDVSSMIEEIIGVFSRRIDDLDWMGDATKQAAQRKLDMLDVRVGCPDVWQQDSYDMRLLFPEEGGLYVDNVFLANKVASDYAFDTLGNPGAHKGDWDMAPQVVNAYYSPSANSITVLAGVLQDPLYSPDAPREENLGRIGMVIAHEITHAFDNGGAQYDETGAVSNWWSDADYEQFQALAEEVVRYYDGYATAAGQVDGTQTLGENIADLGALACVTQIAQEEGLDLAAVYTAYAELWAMKSTKEYAAYLLSVDVHAPREVRANAVLSSLDEFYEVFGVEEGDGMYQAPEERPALW